MNDGRSRRMSFQGRPARLSKESANVRPRLPAGHARKCLPEVPLFCIPPPTPTVSDTMGTLKFVCGSRALSFFFYHARLANRTEFLRYLAEKLAGQVLVLLRPRPSRQVFEEVRFLAEICINEIIILLSLHVRMSLYHRYEYYDTELYFLWLTHYRILSVATSFLMTSPRFIEITFSVTFLLSLSCFSSDIPTDTFSHG